MIASGRRAAPVPKRDAAGARRAAAAAVATVRAGVAPAAGYVAAMWFLLGCAAPTPTLPLPPLPAAEHARAFPVDGLLAPTALGASSEVLCPWARGEAVPDASIARWLSEERLVWRVFDATAGTFGGKPLAEAAALVEAARALDARCGSTRPTDVLVLAPAGSSAGAVSTGLLALGRLGVERWWFAVADPSPAPAPARGAPAPAVEAPAPARVPGAGGSPLDVAAALAARPSTRVALQATEPVTALGPAGAPVLLADALAARPDCAVVVVSPDGAWGGALPLLDAAHGVGAEVMLGVALHDAAAPAPNRGADVALPPVSLHGSVPALEVRAPAFCRSEQGCGCATSALLEQAAP